MEEKESVSNLWQRGKRKGVATARLGLWKQGKLAKSKGLMGTRPKKNRNWKQL